MSDWSDARKPTRGNANKQQQPQNGYVNQNNSQNNSQNNQNYHKGNNQNNYHDNRPKTNFNPSSRPGRGNNVSFGEISPKQTNIEQTNFKPSEKKSYDKNTNQSSSNTNLSKFNILDDEKEEIKEDNIENVIDLNNYIDKNTYNLLLNNFNNLVFENNQFKNTIKNLEKELDNQKTKISSLSSELSTISTDYDVLLINNKRLNVMLNDNKFNIELSNIVAEQILNTPSYYYRENT